jgi:hypothetical protein
MLRPNQRSKGPRAVDGPRVGAIVTPNGVTVRVLGPGERPTLPRATIFAADDSMESIREAARVIVERLRAAARKPFVITVE